MPPLHWQSVLLFICFVNTTAIAALADQEHYIGRRWPSEKKTYTDKVTGLKIIALTTNKSQDSKFYQTSRCWTPDGRYIMLCSDRSGTSQIYAIEQKSGRITQITDDEAGYHACIDRKTNKLYRITRQQLWVYDTDRIISDNKEITKKDKNNYKKLVAEIPEQMQARGEPSVDADDTRLYFEYDGPKSNFKAGGIGQINLATGECHSVVQTPFRAAHVQANPVISSLIMLCNADQDNVPTRIWLFNTDEPNSLRPFYKEHPNDWVTHEVWVGPDRAAFILWPHKGIGERPHGLATIGLSDDKVTVHATGNRYWHMQVTPDGRFAVADTMAGELFLINMTSGKDTLLTTGHRPNENSAHGHPSISPDGRKVLFQSDLFGNCDLMMMEIPFSK